MRRGFSAGHPSLLKVYVSLQAPATVEERAFGLTEGCLPLVGHRVPLVLVHVPEVHTEAQAFDVLELEIAVGDVAPSTVPSREHVRTVGMVVRGRHRNARNAGAGVEIEMDLALVVGRAHLGDVFGDVVDGRFAIRSPNAPRADVVQRVDTHALAEPREHRSKRTGYARIPNHARAVRETSPPVIIPATRIDEPRH